MTIESSTQQEFRIRQSYLITGIVCAICFAVIGIGSVVAAAWNIDGSFPHPIPMAVFCGVFWGAWFIYSVLIIAAYYRERLLVTREAISQQCVFRKRIVKIDDILQVKWRRLPQRGSVVIRASGARIKIHFDNFTAEERKTLVSLLRSAVQKHFQENWNAFQDAHVAPKPEQQLKSRGSAIVCMLLFLVMGGVFMYCSFIGMGNHWLFIGAVNVVVAMWYIWRITTFVVEPSNGETA